MCSMVDAKRGSLRLALATLVTVSVSCRVENTGRFVRTDPPPFAAPGDGCQSSDGMLRLPVWDLSISRAAWEALHADVDADVEVDAHLCLNNAIEPISVELQGASSRRRNKKSFKIKFAYDHALSDVGYSEESDSTASIDKVFLKAFWGDQSLIREAVAFDLWREMGHTAPRTAYVNLRINGDYWGLYAVVEPVDHDYLRRYKYPAGGHLYKATRKYGSRADFKPGRDLEKAFEEKSEDGEGKSRDDLSRLIGLLQDTDPNLASFEREINPYFPLGDYIDRMVWVAFTRNGDGVAQNYYLYNTPREGHDFWLQIPWDSDLCMGASWQDRDDVVPPEISLMLTGGGSYFSERLLMVPELGQRYANRFREIIDHVLSEPVLMQHLEQRAAHVREDLLQDQLRWDRSVAPDEAFDVVRQFLSERPHLLREGIEALWPSYASLPHDPRSE